MGGKEPLVQCYYKRTSRKLLLRFLHKPKSFFVVSYNEIAEANRRAFENQLEKAEVFLAKLNDKKAEELKKWRKKFDAMQKSSHSIIGSKHSCPIKTLKKRTRRQSAWDLGTSHVHRFP